MAKEAIAMMLPAVAVGGVCALLSSTRWSRQVEVIPAGGGAVKPTVPAEQREELGVADQRAVEEKASANEEAGRDSSASEGFGGSLGQEGLIDSEDAAGRRTQQLASLQLEVTKALVGGAKEEAVLQGGESA